MPPVSGQMEDSDTSSEDALDEFLAGGVFLEMREDTGPSPDPSTEASPSAPISDLVLANFAS